MEDVIWTVVSLAGYSVALVTTLVALGVSLFFVQLRSTRRVKPMLDTDNQSKELSDKERSRGSFLATGGDPYIKYVFPEATTLVEAFVRGAQVSGNGPALGWHEKLDAPYKWLSYEQCLERMRHIGSGLAARGLKPGQASYLGIYASNSIQWVLTEYACYNYSMVLVPLYDTLGPKACAYIINQVEIRIVIVDKEQRVNMLLTEKTASGLPSLTQIVYLKDVSEETKQRAQEAGVELLSFDQLEALGREQPVDLLAPSPDDIATICYTSGTTGYPKGVMLSHGNVVACGAAACIQLGPSIFTTEDSMLSYLPLAHMLERTSEATMFMWGGRVGFPCGTIADLATELCALRPTVMPIVPRLLNKIYDSVHSTAKQSRIKYAVLRIAYWAKKQQLAREGVPRNDTIWDKLVFGKIQQKFGGRLRLIYSGSAPTSDEVFSFCRCAFGCVLLEAYGLTECCAPCTVSLFGDTSTGHVGPPTACCMAKLVDVPEMEYWASENKGELCIKGANVFKGYFKEPEKTAEALDSNGWVRTGDIATWLPNGTIKIIDRKKHIFKMSQGEYIAPEKIESVYIASQFVAQIFIHGESLKSCLVGIVVPDTEYVKQWFRKKTVNGNSADGDVLANHTTTNNQSSFSDMCRTNELKDAIFENLLTIGKKNGLHSFEQVKDIYLCPDPFTIDNGLLTPTLKTKRPDCRKRFQKQIEAMYLKLS